MTHASQDCCAATGGWPTRDVLLRYRDGYATGAEKEKVRAHLAECAGCRADYESVRFLRLDLAAAEADRAALESFKPTAQEAALCKRLSDARLAGLARGEGQQADAATREHLFGCAYCRQRLLLASAAAGTGRPALGARFIASIVAEPLERARQAVEKLTLWQPMEAAARAARRVKAAVRRAAEPIRAYLDAAGQACAEGLSVFRSRPEPVYVRAGMELRTLEEQRAEETEAWEIPIFEPDCNLRLRLSRPAPDAAKWGLRCDLTSPSNPEIPKRTRLELHRDDGTLEVSGKFLDITAKPIPLPEGHWMLCVIRPGEIREVLIQIG